MDPDASYQGCQSVPFVDGKEVPPELEVRFDPQKSLAQRDEGSNLLDPVWVEVLQLYLVVVEKHAKEGTRGHPEPMLMEVRDGDNVAVTLRRQLLAAG
jgi:hypothetical protein